jgi:hypothetical protein
MGAWHAHITISVRYLLRRNVLMVLHFITGNSQVGHHSSVLVWAWTASALVLLLWHCASLRSPRG